MKKFKQHISLMDNRFYDKVIEKAMIEVTDIWNKLVILH
jgi:hypothetical protein